MSPERWQRVRVILEDALELEAGRREAFLASACGGDTQLRDEVVSLLDDTDGAFLEPPPGRRFPETAATERAPRPRPRGEVSEVRPGGLPPYTKLVVSTGKSRYAITVVAPLDRSCLIVGGEQFDRSTRARLPDLVAVGTSMCVRYGIYRMTTTRVERIELVE